MRISAAFTPRTLVVTGTVHDVDDLPLVGAQAFVAANPSIKTLTNVKGDFRLEGVGTGTSIDCRRARTDGRNAFRAAISRTASPSRRFNLSITFLCPSDFDWAMERS